MKQQKTLTVLILFVIINLLLTPVSFATSMSPDTQDISVSEDSVQDSSEQEIVESDDAVEIPSSLSEQDELSLQSTPSSSLVPTVQGLGEFVKGGAGLNSFSTSLFSGAATYSYSIEVPPGRGGLIPSLALQYNHHSSGRPGVVGTGWSLTQNLIYRDINGTAKETADDEFRIILGSINDRLMIGSDGAYHTATESFVRITKSSDKWMATTKDGTTYQFGMQVPSNTQQYPIQWHLDKVTDPHGNSVQYFYQTNPNDEIGTLYLSLVEYNGGASRIEFDYAFGLYSPWTVYEGAEKIRQSGILKTIRVLEQGNLVRKYELMYSTLESVAKIFLVSITQYGSDGITSLPPLTFTYYQPKKSWTASRWAAPVDAPFSDADGRDEGVRLVDVNRDGLTDFVRADNENLLHVWYNSNESWRPKQTYSGVSGGIVDGKGLDDGVRFMDMNADGLPDIVKLRAGDQPLREYLRNTGNGFAKEIVPVPNEISFVDIRPTQIACNPSDCPQGYDVMNLTCTESQCIRECRRSVCSGQSRVVYDSAAALGWTTASHSASQSAEGFRPTDPTHCYEFTYVPTVQSDCYRLGSDRNRDGKYNRDCYNNNIDAYGGVGFYSGSWLATISGSGVYVPSGFSGDWQNRYFVNTGNVISPDGRYWNGLENTLCSGSVNLFCAPSQSGCLQSGKQHCGWGCANQQVQPTVSMGMFAQVYGDINDAATDRWVCGSISSNEYFGAGGRFSVTESDAVIDYRNVSCQESITLAKSTGIEAVDLNGDGRQDFVKATAQEKKVWLAPTYAPTTNWAPPSEVSFLDEKGVPQGVAFANVNGDGFVDLIKANNGDRTVWINTGDRWEKSARSFPVDLRTDGRDNGVVILDVNADGLDDVIYSNTQTFRAWINQNGEWREDPLWNPQDRGFDLRGLSTRLVDADGGAVPDIIVASNNNKKMLNNLVEKPYLLKSIMTSMGSMVELDYRTIATLDNTGGDGIGDLGFSGWVVSQVRTSNGMVDGHALTSMTEYEYSGGLQDYADSEFRGFSEVREKMPYGSVAVYKFHQDAARKGLLYESQLYDSDSTLLKKTQNTYDVAQKHSLVVSLSKSTEALYDKKEIPKIVATRHRYDEYGNIVETVFDGDVSDPADDYTVTMEYAINSGSWIVSLPSRKTINAGGNRLRDSLFAYDGGYVGQAPTKGDLTRQELVHSSGNAVTVSTYDQYGNLLTTTDPEGHTATTIYESTGRFPSTMTNALGHVTTVEFDRGTGNLLFSIDPNGARTDYTYDVFGRKTKEILPTDSVQSPTKEITYLFDGDSPETIQITQKAGANERHTSHFSFDGLGRLIQRRDAGVNKQAVTDYLYDKEGKLAAYTLPYFMDPGYPYTAPQQSRIQVSHDALGRTIRILFPDGNVSRVVYDQWTSSAYDRRNNRIDSRVDAQGRIILVQEYQGNDIFSTSYQYIPTGELTMIRDHVGNQFISEYDSLGRLVTVRDPDFGVVQYAYDKAGNRISTTDAKGVKVVSVYDALNRVVQKNVPNSRVTFVYDAKRKGTLSSVQMHSGQTSMEQQFHYDDRLRRVREEKKIDGRKYTTTFHYDGRDRVIRQVNPDSREIEYRYHPSGQITGVNELFSVAYSPSGKPVVRSYQNRREAQMTYDSLNHRLLRIRIDPLQDIFYSSDPEGNLVGINDVLLTKKTEYSYDSLNRLIRAKNSDYDLSYQYDPIGNLKKLQSRDYTLNFEQSSRPAHAPLSLLKDSVSTPLRNLAFRTGSFSHNENSDVSKSSIHGFENAINEQLSSCAPDEGGYCLIPLSVSTDSAGEIMLANLNINLRRNAAPSLAPISPQSIVAGNSLRVRIVAMDTDGDALSYFVDDARFTRDSSDPSSFVWQTSSLDVGSYSVRARVSDGVDTTSLNFTVTVQRANQQPIISSISTVLVSAGSLVSIAVQATDPDGDLLIYSIDHPKFSKSGNSFVWQTGSGDVGEYSATVTVSDGVASVNSTFTITVSAPANLPPVVESIAPIVITEGQTATITVRATDTEGAQLFYSINDTRFSQEGNVFRWETSVGDAGTRSVAISVGDGVNMVKTLVQITVKASPSNSPPVLVRRGDGNINAGDRLRITLTATDQDGDTLSYSLNHTKFTAQDQDFFWQTTADDVGTYDLLASVTDGFSTDSFVFRLTIVGTNKAPVISPIAPISVNEGEEVVLRVIAADPENNPLAYTLNDSRFARTENVFSWKTGFSDAGVYSILASVSDGVFSDSEAVKVTVSNVNRAPVFISQPLTIATDGKLYSYDAQVSDSDLDVLTFQLTSSPLGMSVDTKTGLIQWTPSLSQRGNHTITLVASDGALSATQSFIIVVERLNRAPRFVTAPPGTAVSGHKYVYDADALDDDADLINYSYSGFPGVMGIDSTSGVFEWPSPQAGIHNIDIIASDGVSRVIQTFAIIVRKNHAPVLEAIGPLEATAGSVVGITLRAADNDGDLLHYSLNSSKFIATGSEFAWQTAQADVGIYDLAASVTDGVDTVTQVFQLRVVLKNSAPQVTPIAPISVKEGEEAVVFISATDPDGNTLLFSLNDTRFTKKDTAFSWMTGFRDAGTYSVRAIVSDGSLSNSTPVTLNVANVNQLPLVTSTPSPVARVGLPYLYSLTALDYDGDQLSYSLEAAMTNASIRGNVLQWTPTESLSGKVPMSIVVSDGQATVKQNLDILVSGKKRGPRLINGLEDTIRKQPTQNIVVIVSTVRADQIKAKKIGRITSESPYFVAVELPAHRVWELVEGTDARYVEENGRMGFS